MGRYTFKGTDMWIFRKVHVKTGEILIFPRKSGERSQRVQSAQQQNAVHSAKSYTFKTVFHCKHAEPLFPSLGSVHLAHNTVSQVCRKVTLTCWSLEPEANYLSRPRLHLRHCVQLYYNPHHQGVGTDVQHADRIFLQANRVLLHALKNISIAKNGHFTVRNWVPASVVDIFTLIGGWQSIKSGSMLWFAHEPLSTDLQAMSLQTTSQFPSIV